MIAKTMRIKAALDFLDPGEDKPAFIMQEHGKPSLHTGNYVSCDVEIKDGRVSGPFELDKHGFVLLPSSMPVCDFESTKEIKTVYYHDVMRVLKKQTRASKVYIIDHTIRTSELKPGVRGVASHVHNDYTIKSFPEALRIHIGDESVNAILDRRLMQINVWRPITEPVRVAPLAIADGSSVPFSDLVPCDIVYPDRVGEIYELKSNPNHDWYYFPEMGRDEIILIKGYDSKRDGTVRFTPHSAFSHPETKPTDPIRVSIEVRAIVVI